MIILCNIADWNKNNISLLAKTIYPNAKIINTSSFRKFDELDIISDFYKKMANKAEFKARDENENKEIIIRCRMLRLLKKDESSKIVSAMRDSIYEKLKSNQVDLIITEIVDQYFHDILVREAKKLNIKVIAPIQTFVNGYSRLTMYGENNIFRIPEDREIIEISKKLDNQNYQPNYITKLKISNLSQHIKRVFKNFLRYVYFNLKLLFPRNKYDYHYLASSKGILRYASIFQISSFVENSNWKNNLLKSSKPILYIPLQWYPESTVDYWCKNINVIDFEKVFVQMVIKLSFNFTIAIKEHPASLGLRNPSFIKKVNSLLSDDIFCIPSNIPSNYVVQKTNAVLVWTGSVGFEAAYRGKPVFTMGDPYYASGRFFCKVNLETSLSKFENFIIDCENKPMKDTEKKELVKNLLSGFIKGFFRNDASYDKANKNHVKEIVDLAKNIKKYYIIDDEVV